MWQLRHLARDAAYSLSWPHLALGIAMVVSLVGASFLSLNAAAGSIDQELQVRRAGTEVWSIEADENRDLDAGTCTRLATGEGIIAAGGVVTNQPGSLAVFAGGYELPVSFVTSDFVRVFDPSSAPGEVAVGASLVESGRVQLGGPLFNAGGDQVAGVDQVASEWIPTVSISGSVVVPVASNQTVRKCYIRMSVGNAYLGPEILTAAFGDLRIERYEQRSETLLSPWDQWVEANTLQPGIAAGVVLALVAGILHWFRRGEFALRRAFGSTVTAIGAGAFLEALLLSVCAAGGAVLVIYGWLLTQPVIAIQLPGLAVQTTIAGTLVFIAAYTAIACAYAALRPATSLSDR